MSKKDSAIIMDDTDRLMSVNEMAERLKTSPKFVGKIIDKGLIKVLKFGTNRRIRKVSFNEFLKRYEGQDLYKIVKEE